MKSTVFFKLNFTLILLTFFVVLLGAYVRLSDAGLGCPDWPKCYGKFIVPHAEEVKKTHPDSPFNSSKAWKEMAHRYAAKTFGVLAISLALLSIWKKNKTRSEKILPWVIVAIGVFQGALGRWTVTLKVHPFVVMAHLLGGFSLFLISVRLLIAQLPQFQAFLPLASKKKWILLGIFLVTLQIALGGWMSANYASIACPDLPTCQGKWIPKLDLTEAFGLWPKIGPNYEGGTFDNEARVTLHWMHRVGGLTVFAFIVGLSFSLLKQSSIPLFARRLTQLVLGLVTLQFCLGLSNVYFHLPLPIAVAHNGVAALLLASLIALKVIAK